MTRGLTSAAQTATDSAQVVTIALVYMDFSSGALYLNSSPYNLTWNGYEWLGTGDLGSISAITEEGAPKANGIQLEINGIDTSNLYLALNEHYQGRKCQVYVGFLNVTDHSLIADPILVFDGRMDVMHIAHGKTGSISVTAESRLADWDRPRIRRYSHEDQISRYPGDLGLSFVEEITDKEIIWGRK